MTQQEAYIILKQKIDALTELHEEIFKWASEHDLEVGVVTWDGEISSIDPSRFEYVQKTGRHWDNKQRKMVDGPYKEKRFREDDEEYPGDYPQAWIPSQFC